MADFHAHEPDIVEPVDVATNRRNSRIGLRLFALYTLIYAGFIAVNAFRPDLMETTPFAGINVAILYGFALIVGAFVVALVYGWLCRRPVQPGAGEIDR